MLVAYLFVAYVGRFPWSLVGTHQWKQATQRECKRYDGGIVPRVRIPSLTSFSREAMSTIK